MTPEQILELAARAGADTQDGGKHWEFDDFSPTKFAKLVEAATREECAKRVDVLDKAFNTGGVFAAEIRSGT